MDNPITVNRGELLDALSTNLAKHQEGVDRAQIRYREKVIEELEARLTAARDGKPIDISIFARMPIPRSYAAEYEQAIEELRWHTGETIELSSRDFARFVLDKWEWAQQFAASNMVYLTE
jgi:hypothetical protein